MAEVWVLGGTGRVGRSVADTPFSNVTIKTDVELAKFNYMRERPEYFKGVEVAYRYQREYPEGKLAAQLFGSVSEISAEQLKEKKYKDVEQGTRVKVDTRSGDYISKA